LPYLKMGGHAVTSDIFVLRSWTKHFIITVPLSTQKNTLSNYIEENC